MLSGVQIAISVLVVASFISQPSLKRADIAFKLSPQSKAVDTVCKSKLQFGYSVFSVCKARLQVYSSAKIVTGKQN